MKCLLLFLATLLAPDGDAAAYPSESSAYPGPTAAAPGEGSIGGLVVNGSQGNASMAGAEVLVRAAQGGEIVSVATTVADEHGHFTVAGLPVIPSIEYVTGVNHEGVHYPGPRLVLTPDEPSARVRLTAFDALTDPSPLVAARHELEINVVDKVLEVTETLIVLNPSSRGYVGISSSDSPMSDLGGMTLTISPCPGFGTVTFHQEFLGRNFVIHDGQLRTNLPWPPGPREIRFSYRLPIERQKETLRRTLDLPCSEMRVRVRGLDHDQFECDAAGASFVRDEADGAWVFHGQPLPAGQILELRLRGLPVSPISYGKWIAVAVLGVLAVGVVATLFWPKKSPVAEPPSTATLRQPRRRAA